MVSTRRRCSRLIATACNGFTLFCCILSGSINLHVQGLRVFFWLNVDIVSAREFFGALTDTYGSTIRPPAGGRCSTASRAWTRERGPSAPDDPKRKSKIRKRRSPPLPAGFDF